MIVAFAGPSIYGAALPKGRYDLKGPARQGDIRLAVEEGATVIGLIDGWFGSAAAVWHKEIMFALSRGVAVYGAASMGALRAAECAPYGMVPVGVIAQAYVDSTLDDDAAVALTFGPAELGYPPMVEPLVDVWPTVAALETAGRITEAEALALNAAAEAIFFADRTVEQIIVRAAPPGRRRALIADYAEFRVQQKQIDAVRLLERLCAPDLPSPDTRKWHFNTSPFWRTPGPRPGPLTSH